MRNFYIKQRVFAIGSKFDVLNENEEAEYIVEADKFDLGKNISIYDRTGRKVLYFRQQLRIGAHKYIAYNSNMEEIAEIKKEFMYPEYKITGRVGNIIMRANDFLGRHYDVEFGNIQIGKIGKQISFFRDEYYLEVLDENFTEFLVGLLVIIDMVKYNNKNK